MTNRKIVYQLTYPSDPLTRFFFRINKPYISIIKTEMSILGDAIYRGFGDDFKEADHLAKKAYYKGEFGN
jgi:hypothetical protein